MKLLKLIALLLPAFGWAQEVQPRFVIGTEAYVGFILHFNDHWRMFMRPAYRILAPPAKSGSPIWDSQYHQLHMALGVQRGFFR